jgi:hypothetical protein
MMIFRRFEEGVNPMSFSETALLVIDAVDGVIGNFDP